MLCQFCPKNLFIWTISSESIGNFVLSEYYRLEALYMETLKSIVSCHKFIRFFVFTAAAVVVVVVIFVTVARNILPRSMQVTFKIYEYVHRLLSAMDAVAF